MNSQNSTSKRFFIKTLGCKVNQYESQAMREILERSGFKECLAEDIADLYIVNTCTVTADADKESRRIISAMHRSNPAAKIAVTGCYVEKNSEEISSLPGVAHIIKNSDKNRIAEILNDASKRQSVKVSKDILKITGFKDHTKAFVKIQDGCENFCSYCKVPLVRSSLQSKPIRDTVDEVRALVDKGFKEIILTGICLGAWGKDLPSNAIAKEMGIKGTDLTDVLNELNKMDGDFRIRLSSIEPAYVTHELIDCIARSRKICRHLHVPLQSGDDEILRKMNRPYTVEEYATKIEMVRRAFEGIAITTDILVGFPGETDRNFKNTVDFVKRLLPSRTHIFTFSKREGTAAFNMPQEIGPDIVKTRHYQLKVACLGSSYLYRNLFSGRSVNVLVESRRDKNSGLLTGYSDNYIKVLFDGPDDLKGNIVPVRIEETSLLYTYGVYEG
ncbi:MAG: tRNA (N(6)-L-threonylcarbamoyladenosine(37)-C(2))-methylthiotransferase MtaB [Candidatus Omnitrophica bacterium]|nr:tRNA (N(6)-L-threonylcarbamoyladenosine(37)-C(2))-methylthiotransferase MtaB [Candidatus Omnitrophota bacterium]